MMTEHSKRRADIAGLVTSIILVVATAIAGYLADGVGAAVFIATLVAIGAGIGLAWWFKVGRNRTD